jgi:hypothetical protein
MNKTLHNDRVIIEAVCWTTLYWLSNHDSFRFWLLLLLLLLLMGR